MNKNVEKIYDKSNDIFALPQSYKGIEFYPIKVKQVKLKKLMYNLFAVPKNYIPEKKILKMSYIKFLFYVVQPKYNSSKKEVDLQDDIIFFLKEITKKDDVVYEYENVDRIKDVDDIIEFLKINIVIDGIRFNEQEFENIREIVLEQNGSSVEYVEEYLPDLEEKLSFMTKSFAELDLKDEVYIFVSLTGLSEEEVGEKTLYQFKNRLEREILLKDYELFKPLEMSGQISSKTNEELYKHYFSHIDRLRRYHSLMVEKERFLERSGLGGADGDGNIK